jgi:hypothetical protein
LNVKTIRRKDYDDRIREILRKKETIHLNNAAEFEKLCEKAYEEEEDKKEERFIVIW